jgi:hypothetical protein
MAQPDLAGVPTGGELKPRESIDGHSVGLDTAHVAESHGGTVLAEHRADTLAESGQVGTGDRAANGERDRGRGSKAHRNKDLSTGKNSSARRPMSYGSLNRLSL